MEQNLNREQKDVLDGIRLWFGMEDRFAGIRKEKRRRKKRRKEGTRKRYEQ